MSRADFDAYYREHYRRVFGLCQRLLGAVADAEDATQEVFMRGYRAFGRYRSEEPFEHWISAIASNYCIDVLRRRGRLAERFDDAAQAEATDPDPHGVAPLISEFEARAVAAAVEALPEQYRVPIVLAYYADASYAEIARILGITSSHVGVLLLRGRQRLRESLGGLADQPITATDNQEESS
jgi:RNA polymerase sigma-70 factor (ECF subfamily)